MTPEEAAEERSADEEYERVRYRIRQMVGSWGQPVPVAAVMIFQIHLLVMEEMARSIVEASTDEQFQDMITGFES